MEDGKPTQAGERAGSGAAHGCSTWTYPPSSQVPGAQTRLGLMWEVVVVPWPEGPQGSR